MTDSKPRTHSTTDSRSSQMARVYQLPELHIRGTIASQTMTRTLAELDDQERRQLEDTYNSIISDDDIKPIQGKMVRDLRNTIGCEYMESPAAAKQEFLFVVWKALVYALYHCDYSFKCDHCEATDYRAKSGRRAPITKEMAICPNCGYVECDGRHVHHTATGNQPTTPTVKAVPGARKLSLEEAKSLLTNKKDLLKYLRKFTNGYLQQILRENKIKYEGKRQTVSGFADIIAKQELMGLLDKYNIRCNTIASSSTVHTDQPLEMSPIKFTAEFTALRDRYAQYDVIVETSQNTPSTSIAIHSPTIPAIIESEILTFSPVLILNQPENASIDDDTGSDNSYVIEHRKYTLDGKRRIVPDMPTHTIETDEMFAIIRRTLPDGDPRMVFDMVTSGMYVPQPERPQWDEFATANQGELEEIMRDGGLAVNHKKIAGILGKSTRVVQSIMKEIKIIGTANGYDYGRADEQFD